MLSRPTSGMEKRPFTSWLPVAEVAPVPQRSSSVMGPKPSPLGKPLGGGVWPPPVSFPSRQATSPDLGESKFQINFEWNICFHFCTCYIMLSSPYVMFLFKYSERIHVMLIQFWAQAISFNLLHT